MLERIEAYDLGMLFWFCSWRGPWLNPALLALTHLGDFLVLVAVVVVGVIFFFVRRQPRLATTFLLAGLCALLLERGVKYLIGRPRPDVSNALAELPTSPSFPSGHALGTMAVYLTLALLLVRLAPKWGSLFVLVGVCTSLLVGLTRVVIGVHYPLDVLAGWVVGLLVALTSSTLAGEGKPPPSDRSGGQMAPSPGA